MPRLQITSRLRRLRLDAAALARFLRGAASALGLQEGAVVELRCVSAPAIRRLKERHFGLRRSTDVITLGTSIDGLGGPGPALLGEIILCPEFIAASARSLGVSFGREALFCFTHGLLHLLGWDDDTPARRRRMFRRQEAIIQAVARDTPGRDAAGRLERIFRWRSA